jgi:uncharacterized protein YpmS
MLYQHNAISVCNIHRKMYQLPEFVFILSDNHIHVNVHFADTQILPKRD